MTATAASWSRTSAISRCTDSRPRPAPAKPVPAFATTSDGRTISITNQPMTDGGFVATHEDITERQRSQRELKSTKIFLDTVIENIPLPLVVKDARTQKFIFVNHAYEDFIGRTRDQLIGLTVHDLFPPQQPPEGGRRGDGGNQHRKRP